MREAYQALVDQGWTNALRSLHPAERVYTFWDYFRNAYSRDAGLHIDHLLLAPSVAKRLGSAGVDREVRGWDKSIDHANLDRARMTPLHTPDGRYIIVRGRLWRTSNPNLSAEVRDDLVQDLMEARRRVRTQDVDAKAQARRDVDKAKRGLGERGPVWWDDGAPDYNRHMARNTPYREWAEMADVSAPTES